MKEQNWKRKEYESWDEAFRGLAPVVRQQSVRVAAYTQALFVQALKNRFGCNTAEGKERMKGQYTELMYKCGMYHQLGKALVPPEYQIFQKDFTEEELAVYKKYTTDGRTLVSNLQEKSARAKEKNKGEYIERPTKNIPWLITRECCEQHMERWDGSGFPLGRLGSDISPVAQIVGMAKELDRIASETRSETPFDIAYETILKNSGKDWAPELVEVLKFAKDECLAVYNKYINYTRTLPKTIPLVERKEDRAMGLKYRAMLSDEGIALMYEATPWFMGALNQPNEAESIQDLRELFKRTNLVEDLSWYFLYEAADTVLRINNCKLCIEAIILEMIPEFYLLGTQLQKFNKLFEDQPIEKDKLLLTIPMGTLQACNKTNLEIIERYLRNGIGLVLEDYRSDTEFPIQRLLEMHLTRVRIDPQLYCSPEGARLIYELRSKGITVLAKNADTPEILSWLNSCGVLCSSGAMNGIPVSEDEMILDSLAREEA